MHNFKELKVWKQGMEIAKNSYLITKAFPAEERYGLTSQMNRSAVSIPSNIAEGCGRKSTKELYHFLNIALGSAFELETQLILSFDFGFIKEERFTKISSDICETQKMIVGLQKSLNI